MKAYLFSFIAFVLFTNSTYAQCWKTVCTGANHCIAIKNDGTLWAWGNSNNGQLGNGGTGDIYTPYQIGFANDWNTVATGKSSTHNLAIKNDGTLWAWGYNFYGQLGFDAGVDYLTPMQVGTDNDWSKVACGMFFSMAIKADGTLWGWGSNDFGQVDESNSSNFILVPTQISSATNWVEVTCGDAHSLALTNEGEMYGSGFNFFGAVGNGNSGAGSQAVLQQIGNDQTWLSIAAGDSHSLAVRSDNTLWSWGTSTSGELGNGVLYSQNTIPTQVGTETNWAKVFSGEYFSLGIKTDGTLWAWGSNGYGQLGIGNNDQQLSPVQVGTDNNWTSAQGGREHTIALKDDDSAMTWGRNTYGTIGNGTHGGDGTGLNIYSNVPLALLCGPVGIDESFADNTISIYPNPAVDIINLRLPNSVGVNSISIYNAMGALQYISYRNSSIVDISILALGTYVIVIETNEGRYRSLFVRG
jgi:alpha-tubulin suppressor-like RCC1 family protein